MKEPVDPVSLSPAPNLLDDDGTASIATGVMMSHHGFRRDLRRFSSALAALGAGGRDALSAERLRDEWGKLHGTLHGHHEAEDNGLFPSILSEHVSARATIDRLSADHRQIDPILARGDRAFAALPAAEAVESAGQVIAELQRLLTPHLGLEEAELIPFLRGVKTFPAFEDETLVAMYADGFAWGMQGIAPQVVAKLEALLPDGVRVRLPAARAAFEERCRRVWGEVRAGAATTPIPDGA